MLKSACHRTVKAVMVNLHWLHPQLLRGLEAQETVRLLLGFTAALPSRFIWDDSILRSYLLKGAKKAYLKHMVLYCGAFASYFITH